MLNISKNSITQFIKLEDFRSYELLKKSNTRRLTLWLISGLAIGIFLCLFLPWTQNISAKGYVTTRMPGQRPQALQSVIGGRLDQWFVQEGDYVEKGDSIVFLSEVKSEYFDPELLERTAEQIEAKNQSVNSYSQKLTALENQYNALLKSLDLKREQTINKIEQTRNKIQIDSIDLKAYQSNLAIAENQLSRTKELYDKGLKSLTDLQDKQYKLQSASAKVDVQKNKILNLKNILINMKIEISAIEQEYADKLSKSLSDRQSALSAKLESVASSSKLQNQYSNYSERQKFYYVRAPQSGYITKTIKKGLGESVKAGADIVTIMPAEYDLAVEMYLKPQDLTLLQIGDKVQLRFDGWPAIVISGWPESSTGVFSGNIVAIDKFISENGAYRVIVSPNNEKKQWPKNLSVGIGANAFILLKKVPIWYEIWRQLNGFPPDYYRTNNNDQLEVKRKAPIKSVK